MTKAGSHHKHRCNHCGTVWEHHNDCSRLAKTDPPLYKNLHRCPRCRKPSVRKYQETTPVNPTLAAELCFGLGFDTQQPPAPGHKSRHYAVERNGTPAGHAYIDINDPDPRAKVWEMVKRQHIDAGNAVVEVWHGTPCNTPPRDYIA